MKNLKIKVEEELLRNLVRDYIEKNGIKIIIRDSKVTATTSSNGLVIELPYHIKNKLLNLSRKIKEARFQLITEPFTFLSLTIVRNRKKLFERKDGVIHLSDPFALKVVKEIEDELMEMLELNKLNITRLAEQKKSVKK